MKILVTGVAGFIGHHTASRLLLRGDTVVGVDSLNDYYDVSLKRDRLAILERLPGFEFRQLDIARRDLPAVLGESVRGVDAILHLAAQAGVRHSIVDPYAYVEANVTGQVAILELAARLPKKPPVVYASSSSVYGLNEPIPFAETARADQPISVYAATKRAGEMMAHAYGSLHGVRTTGLRFFSVYGRFGRPDMAPWLFTDAILRGKPISVFNNGNMFRDFTHIDDITSGVVSALDRTLANPVGMEPVYNLGHNQPVRLLDFIGSIERAAGRKAIMEMKPKPAGDVDRTFADIALAQRDLGFHPSVSLDTGIADFVDWYRDYSGLVDRRAVGSP